MADPKEAMLEFLKAEGYVPTEDGQGIMFKREGQTYFTFPDAGDPNFFNLFSYFDFAGAVPSRIVGLETANDVNKGVKALKVTLMDAENANHVSFGLEVPLPSAEGFREVFGRALNTIAYGVEQFAERMRARLADHLATASTSA